MPGTAASEPTPGRDGAGLTDRTPTPTRSESSRSPLAPRAWLVAAVTFVAGVLVGAVAPVGDRGDGTGAAGPSASPAVTPSPATTSPPQAGPPAAVPASCVEIGETADQLADLVRDAAVAAGRLDAGELSAIVRRMEESQVRLQAQSTECTAPQQQAAP